jgi:hypothetical protein
MGCSGVEVAGAHGLGRRSARAGRATADALAVLHPELEEELLRLPGGLADGHTLIILLNINTWTSSNVDV